MMPYFLIASILSFFIFFRIPLFYEETPAVYPLIRLSLLDKPESFQRIPEIDNSMLFNAIVHQDKDDVMIKFPYRKDLKLDDKGSLAFAPFLGSGFFIYKKVGNEISFQSGEGEVLWKKQYSSYPVSDPFGRIILLLTGDNNRVDLIDLNGNPLGVTSVSGNFLADYDFSLRDASVAMAFANGDIVLLGKAGNVLSRINLGEYLDTDGNETLFVKSVSISADGSLVGVHYVFRERDSIAVFRWNHEKPGKLGLEYTVNLERIYPHILHFAPGRGGLLVAAPDATMFFSRKGKLEWKKNVKGEESVYRPVFCGDDFFVFMDGKYTAVLSEDGNTVDSFILDDAGDGPFAILPHRRDGQFSIRNDSQIHIYQYRSPSPSSI